MTVNNVINSIFGIDNFADYEQDVYKKYQEQAEREIIDKLDDLLSNLFYLEILKKWAAKCACRFIGYRKIQIRLKSGQQYEIASPVFYRSKPKSKKRGRKQRQKGVTRHLGLEVVGIMNKISPSLVGILISMAVLCPSFEVAANALRGLGIVINECLLQNITHKFAGLVKQVRVECHDEFVWQKSGLRILICVDGGRIRERTPKRGRRKKGQKRQGYHTEWFEPKLLTISQFGENGKKIRSINPILDGSCGSMEDFFELLKEYLKWINVDEASEIVFCADGGNGIWPRTDKLINELGLNNTTRVLDYTHAKQNMNIVKKTVLDTLSLSEKQIKKFSKQVRELLWNGKIKEITDLIKKELTAKKDAQREKALEAVSKKLGDYFREHSKFQYKTFKDKGLPTGSGTVESAIRRVINLRIKGTGLFWKRVHAENVLLLRSLVLSGDLKSTCRRALGIGKKLFENNAFRVLDAAV